MRLVALTLVVLLTVTAVPPGGAAETPTRTFTTDQDVERPRVVAAYPNPVAPDDAGEFVVVAGGGENLTLTDGESSVHLPTTVGSGPVALSADPTLTRKLTDRPVVGVDLPVLSNAGETLRLRRANRTVAVVRYDDAPEGEVRRWPGEHGGEWRPLGATDLPVVETDGGPGTAFVLPDAADVAVETLRGADRRVLLAGYTFTSERATRALVDAADRGVRVRVLVDGGPVGGMTRREARVLDRLVESGVDVRVLAGPRARYAFHHAKYAVVDDRALVLTENWKPAGTGGRASRGWGVRLRDPETAQALAETFRADAGWRDAVGWRSFREGRTFEPPAPANGTYPSRFAPTDVAVSNASVLVAPDNAESAVEREIDGAEESLRVLQVSVDGPRYRLLQATLRAARRGVEVRVLLSSAWYVHDENRRLVDWLEARAAAEDLPLSARLADPGGRFEKVHAKGVVVDGETVLVGSLNWNANSARENREVVLALESRDAARFFGRVFDADWRRAGGEGQSERTGPLPVGLLVVVALGAVAVLLAARRLEFE